MHHIKLALPADIERTPEIDAWLKHCEDKINEEALKRWENLMLFGTTHPEVRMTATEVKKLNDDFWAASRSEEKYGR